MRILVTTPPMVSQREAFTDILKEKGFESHFPDVVQAMTEDELIELLPDFNGWIIGDDPANRRVLTAGKKGKLKAAVRWGIGMDNVDSVAARDLGIEISNTPGVFGKEVGDIAFGYVVALARSTFQIDRAVRNGRWPKTTGISLSGKTVALVGLGDIGRNTAKRLVASEMRIIAYDPMVNPEDFPDFHFASWPERIAEADFIVLTCPLLESTKHIINSNVLAKCKDGVRVVNVSRGGLVDEAALVDNLRAGKVHSAALEVAEIEPLPPDSPLREFDQCLFGCHNASNTFEAIERTSRIAIDILCSRLQ